MNWYILVFGVLLIGSAYPLSAQVLPDSTNTIVEEEDSISQQYIRQGKYRKAAYYLMQQIQLSELHTTRNTKAHQYRNLAVVLNKLHLYPQALKCYNKALQYQQADERCTNNDAVALCEELDLDATDTTEYIEKHTSTRSISNVEILEAYNDGKQAVAYGIVLHVRQPLAGKRKRFIKVNQVGHTFITLIKYNADCTQVSRSFGYYPRKKNLLSATPLSPLTTSQFKDDGAHDWHELIAKFISPQQYDSIVQLITVYGDKPYHLSHNNCTDFGLQAAAIAGISVGNTQGAWPLGYGDNPADAGTSIMEGRINNADTNSTEGLFICTYPMYQTKTENLKP